ncbi:hypothetical protein [Microbulbifer sp. A4B17]|uniref:hypothetical protein n=1 Tax=Microbulbifer sp. A4B17 TaxID=359370 RepID=UPI001300A75D|nr:hypothetical protein [Microbulbifer sp. A4B17]
MFSTKDFIAPPSGGVRFIDALSVEYDNFGRPKHQYDVLDGEVSNGANGITSGIQEHYTNTGALEYVTDLNTGREVYRA